MKDMNAKFGIVPILLATESTMFYSKKASFLLLGYLLFVFTIFGHMPPHAHASEKPIVIYSSTELYIIEYMRKRLQEKFPQYEIILEYLNTGAQAAKLKAEGLGTSCDITYDLSFEYLDLNKDILADLPFDFSVFVDEAVPESKKYIAIGRFGCSVIINTELLTEKGLAIPRTYADLLKPEYKNLISMPNPISSGTGYFFVKALVNAWGEEEAFAYFDALSENILQFTSSGAGSVNSLVRGESAIVLGMIPHAVLEINKGANIKLIELDVASPYYFVGFGVIKGKEKRKPVMDVANFIYTELIGEISNLYSPEQIYKDRKFTLKNYPTDIEYADMSNGGLEERQRLLDKWEY